jgi:hypothetical protein
LGLTVVERSVHDGNDGRNAETDADASDVAGHLVLVLFRLGIFVTFPFVASTGADGVVEVEDVTSGKDGQNEADDGQKFGDPVESGHIFALSSAAVAFDALLLDENTDDDAPENDGEGKKDEHDVTDVANGVDVHVALLLVLEFSAVGSRHCSDLVPGSGVAQIVVVVARALLLKSVDATHELNGDVPVAEDQEWVPEEHGGLGKGIVGHGYLRQKNFFFFGFAVSFFFFKW